MDQQQIGLFQRNKNINGYPYQGVHSNIYSDGIGSFMQFYRTMVKKKDYDVGAFHLHLS